MQNTFSFNFDLDDLNKKNVAEDMRAQGRKSTSWVTKTTFKFVD